MTPDQKASTKKRQRVLREFPWIWGMQQHWHPFAREVKVLTIQPVDLQQFLMPETRWWMYTTYKSWYGEECLGHELYEDVRKLNGNGRKGWVSRVALDLCLPNYRIQHLAHEYGAPGYGGSYFIYKPPKGMDLHEVCEKVAKR